MTTPEPTLADAPSLVRSLLFACATVAFVGLSLGALYLQSSDAVAPVAASR